MKRILNILIGVMFSICCFAQSGSPSSRYGFGEMDDNIANELRAMGGVLTAMRSNHTINPSQPASYTAGDSLSFMFDVGMSVGWTNYKDAFGTKNVPIGALDYITMQFPLYKRWLAFSCGIVPYSHVNYDFVLDGTANNYDYSVNYLGSGGLSQVYAGLGFNILDWFAAGANAYYMFGSTENITTLTFESSDVNSSSVIRYMDLNAFRITTGAQLFHTFAKHHQIILGATFDPKMSLGGDYLVTEMITSDTAVVGTGCDAPMKWSVGLNYTWHDRLTIAADYSCQKWSDARYFGMSGFLNDRQKISVGAQYQNNMYGMKYYDRMIWRVGASVMNNYTQSGNWQDFVVSLGLGFPLRTAATVINTTFQYGRKTSLAGLKENNMTLTIDVAVNEQWFHKRKL